MTALPAFPVDDETLGLLDACLTRQGPCAACGGNGPAPGADECPTCRGRPHASLTGTLRLLAFNARDKVATLTPGVAERDGEVYTSDDAVRALIGEVRRQRALLAAPAYAPDPKPGLARALAYAVLAGAVLGAGVGWWLPGRQA